MSEITNISGSFAAGNAEEFGNEGHILIEGESLKKAAACMDPRLPYINLKGKYARGARLAGLKGHQPWNIYATAKVLAEQGYEVVETHDDCGAFKLAELEDRKKDDPYITLKDLNPGTVNLRAKKYGRNLADIMEAMSNDEIKVESVHITKDELDDNHGAGKAHIFGKGVIPYYGQPGFMIGGGFDEDDILDSAEIAIGIGEKPFEILYVGGKDIYYDANIIRRLTDTIANHEHAKEIKLMFGRADNIEGDYTRQVLLFPAKYDSESIVVETTEDLLQGLVRSLPQ